MIGRGGNNEGGSGTPSPMLPENSELRPVLEPGVLKAFVVGLVVGNLNKGLVLGFLLGAMGGVYAQQNFTQVPDVKSVWHDFKARWGSGRR